MIKTNVIKRLTTVANERPTDIASNVIPLVELKFLSVSGNGTVLYLSKVVGFVWFPEAEGGIGLVRPHPGVTKKADPRLTGHLSPYALIFYCISHTDQISVHLSANVLCLSPTPILLDQDILHISHCTL